MIAFLLCHCSPQENKMTKERMEMEATTFTLNSVGEGDLRNFAGVLDAKNTIKGVFVTTSSFTSSAKKYVEKSPKRIILIDGKELARLMVE